MKEKSTYRSGDDYVSSAARKNDTCNCRYCGCPVAGATKISEGQYDYLCNDCFEKRANSAERDKLSVT